MRSPARQQHLILVVELIVIVGFVAFWFMQTRELWEYPTREQKSQNVDQVLAEAGREREPEPEMPEEPAPRPSRRCQRSQHPRPAEGARAGRDVDESWRCV